MSLPNNYKLYPENVLEPRKVTIDGDDYTLHSYKFRGLQDFYDFLKKNPQPNYDVFSHRLSSVAGSFEFAGVPYDKAVEKLIADMDPGYQEYLTIQRNLHARSAKIHQYEPIKTIAGGNIDPVSYVTGSPKIYNASRLVVRPKFLTINTQVAYYCGTSKEQVFNRALIITNLIYALEKSGYNVDINSFMVAREEDELIQAVFEIKRHGERTNYQALYKSLVDVEFFRRCCFRLIEIADVQNDWSGGYGHTCDKYFVSEIMHLKKDDIYFDQPDEMEIYGHNIESDFENSIKRLHLENSIDISSEQKVLRESIKTLRKGK